MGQSCVSGKTEAPMESVEKTDETKLHVEETGPYTKEIEQSKVSSPSNGDPTVILPTENTLKKEEIKPEKVTEKIEEQLDEITENAKETKTDELRIPKEDASKARKDTTVKVIGNQLAFHGTRSLSGSPTLCSMAVKLWIANENDDDAVGDFGVHVGTVEGLTSNKSKIYVKITLENLDSDMKRIKKKTKPKKLTQTVTFGKDVVLHKVPSSFANRGRLTVAVWSQSAKKNKRLCDVDIELGRQTRFGDQKNDVMTLSQKLSLSKDRTDATLYLC
uniref:C2 domain-containing protein n=1 Tax=Ciona savignyi TaxID=51511 RepID=H2ZM83_CIOSA